MKKIRVVQSALAVAAAVVLVGVGVAPAQAVDSPARYGQAQCSNSQNPGSQALNWGTAKHEIEVTGYVYWKLINMGANPGYSRFKVPQHFASWATISSPGGQRLISTSWACRASSWV